MTTWSSAVALGGLLGAAACNGTCPAANVKVADDAVVSGVTGNDVIGLAAAPVPDLPVVWRFGGDTTVSGTLTVSADTARKVNRADCVPACHTTYNLLLACPPDTVQQEASATLSSSDGRLDGTVFVGHTTASETADAGLVWSFTGERSTADGPLPFTSAELDVGAGFTVDAVRVFLGGDATGVTSVSFSVSSHSDDTIQDSALGSPPA
ncbi:MAG: hypothetical protein H6733_06895 [Alphaproteobacteria bacterium]|nr:hypothetical protein [Alphaproteobacteria bacterium]